MFIEEKTQGETQTPATLLEWQKLMLKAADLIEEHGHIQGCYGNAGIGLCVLGALHLAVGIKNPDSVPDHPGVTDAVDNHLFPAIKVHASDWNDHPERTKDQVVAKLRAVALSREC